MEKHNENLKWADEEHEYYYSLFCSRMEYLDEYHRAVAYLLALDENIRNHVSDVFDFDRDVIILEGIDMSWQTGTSKKVTRLAFNLWDGCCSDGEKYISEEGYELELPSAYYTPSSIFCCNYAPYFWEAIKLRYPCYIDN